MGFVLQSFVPLLFVLSPLVAFISCEKNLYSHENLNYFYHKRAQFYEKQNYYNKSISNPTLRDAQLLKSVLTPFIQITGNIDSFMLDMLI